MRMVVSVMPCVLSAPAVIGSRASVSRASPSAMTTRVRLFMLTSSAGWSRPRSGSRLAQRPCQAGADLGPGGLHVGRRGRALGHDRLDPVVDLVLAPVPHRRRHPLEEPRGGVLDGRRPPLLELGPPAAEV